MFTNWLVMVARRGLYTLRNPADWPLEICVGLALAYALVFVLRLPG